MGYEPVGFKRSKPVFAFTMAVIFFVTAIIVSVVKKPALWPILPYAYRAGCPRFNQTSPDIVVYIPSPIQWRSRRQQVMRTMRASLGGTHVYFVLGTRTGPQLEAEVDHLAEARDEERAETDPLVRYLFTDCRDFGDELDNANGTSSTTCKVYEALRFIVRAYAENPPRFVWRGADDAHLDLNVFRQYVAPKLQTCRLFLGRIRFPSPGEDTDLELLPHQPSLYALYGLQKFGKYMLGMGFCMSWDVVRLIGEAPVPPRLTWCEDVMVGQWLLFHDVDFVDIHQVAPNIGMHNADNQDELTWLRAAHPTYRILLMHKMNSMQWSALEKRPKGDASARFLFKS